MSARAGRQAVAVVLLVATTRVQATDCATRSVPAATLLVPYFRVALGGSKGDVDIPEGGADTQVSVTNPGATGVLAQVTVWSKYGKPVFAFNVPLTAHDTAIFRMRDVLNGRLNNVNPNAQRPFGKVDPCGLNTASGVYAPATGFGSTRYIRFGNPDPEDAARAVAVYPAPAFTPAERLRVWDSLDESGDVRSLGEVGANVLDADNPACEGTSDGVLSGDLSGSLTIDVVNYCTTRLPDDSRRFSNDILATSGWEASGYSPNTLVGDVAYVDENGREAHVSGDGIVALPFDAGLDWTRVPTFYARYAGGEAEAAPPASVPARFRFAGDGRRPLGSGYAFRFLSDWAAGLRSWAIVWRSDLVPGGSPARPQADLCAFRRECLRAGGSCFGMGTSDPSHVLSLRVFDNDGNSVACDPTTDCPGAEPRAVFLQTQRLDLLENVDFDPVRFAGGYVELTLPGNPLTNQALVAVQHSGPGFALSVGHAATGLRPAAPCAISRQPFVAYPRPEP